MSYGTKYSGPAGVVYVTKTNGGITTGGGPIIPFHWVAINSSQTLTSDTGYICNGGGTLSLLLPPVSFFGDEIEITLDGSTGFILTQGAGQSVKFAHLVTTTGAGGSLASTSQGDSLRMVCSIDNLRWNVLSADGNLTIV